MGFLKDIKGTVAPLFGLMLPTFILLMLVTTEYSRISSLHSALQHTLDSALLAAAKENPDSDKELKKITDMFIAVNIDQMYDGVAITTKVKRNKDGVIQGHAAADVPLIFGSYLGIGKVNVNAYTETVAAATTRVELALVLDTTGSMSGSRIAALKKAADDLINTVMDGKLVEVAVVPFATYVNVGKKHRDHKGLDIPDDSNGTKTCKMVEKWQKTGCKKNPDRKCEKVKYTCTKDGVKKTCTKNKCTGGPKNICTGKKKVEKKQCKTTGKKTWHGCVGSREAPYNTDIKDASYGVPGLMNQSCGNELLRLTTVKSDAASAVKKLSTNSSTYIPSGLIWGWRTLSPDYPFPDGSDPATSKEDIIKAIVLMTDGENTVSKKNKSEWHKGSSQSDADKVTEELCTNIKDDNIMLYTIAFEVTDKDTKKMLEGCATIKQMYYDASDAGELTKAFEKIADELTMLRIKR